MTEASHGEKAFKDWLTTAEVAQILDISQRRVRQLIRERAFEAIEVNPRLKMVYKPSLEEYIKRKKAEG